MGVLSNPLSNEVRLTYTFSFPNKLWQYVLKRQSFHVRNMFDGYQMHFGKVIATSIIRAALYNQTLMLENYSP